MAVAMSSAFDYYSPIPIQNSIIERWDREISPMNALQAGSPIEFLVVTGEGDGNYLDLTKSYFYLKVKTQTSADANPDAAAEVSCIQNLGHSMWQRFQVFLGDKEIGDPNALYPYRAFMASLLSHSKGAQEYWMENEGFFERDTAGKMDIVRVNDGNVGNKGLLARHNRLGKGEEIELFIHPVHELFNCPLCIVPGVQLKVRFTPSSNAFVLTRGAGTDAAKLVILDAKFICNTIKTSAAQHVAVLSALREVGAVHYPLNVGTTKHLSIAAGKTTADLDNIYLGAIPNRILMAMVRDDALAGSYGLNPFDFQHFNVDEIVLMVNGKFFPTQPMRPDFTNKRYIRAYYNFLEGMNKGRSELPVPITYSEYGNGYTFFIFDLTPDGNCESSYSPQGTGSVRLLIKFKELLARSIDIILIAEADGWVDIDKYHNVTYNCPL